MLGTWSVNIPGEPLGDTCVYARDFAKLKEEGKAPAATYAHVAREKGRPGLAVQYWLLSSAPSCSPRWRCSRWR